MHDYQKDWVPCTSTSDVPINKETQTYSFYCDASTQTDDTYLKSTNASSKTMAVTTQTESKMCVSVGVQVCKPVFTFEHVENIDSKILYHTGIPDRQTFHAVFDGLKDKETVASGEFYHGRPR